MMGGSLGLAVLASVAAAQASHLIATGVGESLALLGGYHVAFGVGAIFAGLAAVLALRIKEMAAPSHHAAH